MRESLLSLVAKPIFKGPLRLVTCGRKGGGDIVECMHQSLEGRCAVPAIAEED